MGGGGGEGRGGGGGEGEGGSGGGGGRGCACVVFDSPTKINRTEGYPKPHTPYEPAQTLQEKSCGTFREP